MAGEENGMKQSTKSYWDCCGMEFFTMFGEVIRDDYFDMIQTSK